MSVLVYLVWFFSLYRQYGFAGLESAMQSWSLYRNAAGSATVGQMLLFNLLYQGLKWGVLTYLLAGLSLFSRRAIWMEMLGILGLLGPLALDLLGVMWIRKLPYLLFLVYGEADILLDGFKLTLVLAAAAAGYVVMRWGRVKWVR